MEWRKKEQKLIRNKNTCIVSYQLKSEVTNAFDVNLKPANHQNKPIELSIAGQQLFIVQLFRTNFLTAVLYSYYSLNNNASFSSTYFHNACVKS